MEQKDFYTLLHFFKVMSHKSRLKIVGILASRECSVEELATLLDLREPTVSHHLAKLKEIGLVTMRAEGNTHLYQLDSKALQAMNKDVFTPEKMASLANGVETEAWKRKVLTNFLDGERLKEIPASRKKRLVILEWLANRFEMGISYPESAVNEIIKSHHPDSAILRRELIGHKLLQRENGIYWRLPEASGVSLDSPQHF